MNCITRATRANMFAAMQMLSASVPKAQKVSVNTSAPKAEEIVRPALKNAEMVKPNRTTGKSAEEKKITTFHASGLRENVSFEARSHGKRGRKPNKMSRWAKRNTRPSK